jgi:pre-rRNA-processing protein IPI3
MFFAASKDGSIHQMNLFRQREEKSGGHVMEAIGGAGVTDIIRVGDEDQTKAQKQRLISVGSVPFFFFLIPRHLIADTGNPSFR